MSAGKRGDGRSGESTRPTGDDVRPRSSVGGTPGRSSPSTNVHPGAEADLPPAIRALIRQVVDATGLELPDRHDVARELEAHFEDGLDAGVPAEELIRRFGDPLKAAHRIAKARRDRARSSHTKDPGRTGMSGSDWTREFVRSARALARAPGFSLLVVLTLALGVGANTAVFSVLDAVLFTDLPYAEPDRLVRVYEWETTESGAFSGDGGENFVRGPTMAAMREWDDVFDGAASLYTYRETGADLTDGDVPRRVTVLPVSAGYFEVLGIPPLLGRTFVEEESVAPGASEGRGPIVNVAVLSHGLWQNHYGADPGIVGRTVVMDGASYEVVGVMPAGFQDPFGPRADLWTPQDLRRGDYNSWGNFYLSAVARLPRGMTVDQAQERLSARFAALRDAENINNALYAPRLLPLHDDVVGDTRRAMLLLLAGAAALVLLSACVNVANLVFARGLGRSRDAALKAALGSGRMRLVAGTLSESALLAVAGGLVGMILGWFGVRALLAVAPDALPVGVTPGLSPRVFLFAMAVSILALLAFALAPALKFASTPPGDALRHGERGSTGGGRLGRLRDALVVVQVAAGLVLLTGAGLLTRSFLSLQDVDLAIEPEPVLTFEVHLPDARYDGPARARFQDELHRRVSDLPGVEAAGAISWLPVNGTYHNWSVRYVPPGESDPGDNSVWYGSNIRVVNGDYFGAMDIDVLRGPPLTALDPAGDSVVWVNERLTEIFGGRDPIGQVLRVGNADRRVIGVVENVPEDTRGALRRKVYVPHAQFADNRNWALIQTVRTRGDLASVREQVRETLAGLDGQLVLYQPKPFTDVLAAGRARDRFATVLMGSFAMLALILTLVGTYGILSHAVAGRRREIGIRMALGADTGSVRGMVMRYATALAVPGVLIGVAAAWYGSRWVEALLFEVGAADPVVYGGTVVLVLGACLAAGYIPARRATRVDPARTLTVE